MRGRRATSVSNLGLCVEVREREQTKRRLADAMSAELITNMRARIEQCRRLAKYINDPRTTEALLRMAEHGEVDLKKLEAEEALNRSELKMPPQA
jgi:hypothetical protein